MPRSSDALLAFIIGPAAWARHGSRSSGFDRLGLALGLGGLFGVGTTSTVLAIGRSDWPALAASWISVVVLALPSLLAVIGRSELFGPAQAAAPRVAAIAVLAVVAVRLASWPELLLFWPMWVVLGAESAITARELGREVAPGEAVRATLRSPLHLGLLSGLCVGVAVALLTDEQGAVQLLVLVESWLLGGLAARVLAGLLLTALDDEGAAIAQAALVRAGRHRAHWLHDDVCAEVRALKLRLATDRFSVDEVAAQLDELDFRLRTRQLDEIVQTGTVSAAEVIQPYVRRAQNLGIELREMPRLEDGSIELDQPSARLLRMAASGLIANAINAGASWLRISVDASDSQLVFGVADDAGGFLVEQAPAGRGLQSLIDSLGAGRLEATPTDDGTSVVASISLERSAT